MFAEQYPDRDYDDLKDMVQIGWLRKAHKEILSALSTTPVAETAGEVAQALEEAADFYQEAGKHRAAKELRDLIDRLPTPVPAQDDDKLRIAVEALEDAARRFDEIYESVAVDDVAYRNEQAIRGINGSADVAQAEIRETLAALQQEG